MPHRATDDSTDNFPVNSTDELSPKDTGGHVALALLEAELREVQSMLDAAADDLGRPLGDLVQAQIRRAAPLVRAALVLAAGYAPSDDPLHRRQRILLAAALEMLYVALHIHRLLIDASSSTQEELDKSLIGSTILAGDYCFSRAATMAAQTDNPKVVAIFAQALQMVSEGQLRPLFDQAAAPFDEEAALRGCGVEAALELAGGVGAERISYAGAARTLVQRLSQLPPSEQMIADLLPAMAPARHSRWRALIHWSMTLPRKQPETSAPPRSSPPLP